MNVKEFRALLDMVTATAGSAGFVPDPDVSGAAQIQAMCDYVSADPDCSDYDKRCADRLRSLVKVPP